VTDSTPDVRRALSVDRILLVLLMFVPATLTMVWGFGLHGTPVFIASAVSIIPLAGYMGRATERLSEHLGAGWGGFLNATFGNAAELIIAIMALRAGLMDVVKASLTGSIIGVVDDVRLVEERPHVTPTGGEVLDPFHGVHGLKRLVGLYRHS